MEHGPKCIGTNAAWVTRPIEWECPACEARFKTRRQAVDAARGVLHHAGLDINLYTDEGNALANAISNLKWRDDR